MTKAEFASIIRILKGNYRYNNFLPDEQIADSWFNILNQYQYQDIMVGVTEYIKMHSDPPTVADLSRSAAAAAEVRKFSEREKNSANTEKLVRCPRCYDTGYTLKLYPNGSSFMTPCGCMVGREKFPWYFMPEEEMEKILREEQRKGMRPTIKPFRASKEFKAKYLSDTTGISEKYLEIFSGEKVNG